MNRYLHNIDAIAGEHGIKSPYEARLLEAWSVFERDCMMLNPSYDILSPRVSQEFLGRMSNFVRLLYENDDSSPRADCDQIREKDAAYGGSWHARGGTGAFHALARKGDRLKSMLGKFGTLAECRKDSTNSESIDDTIGDLRRYLILVLAWHVSAKQSSLDQASGTHALHCAKASDHSRRCDCGLAGNYASADSEG